MFYEKGGNEDAPYAYKIYHLLVTLCYVLDLYISFHLTYVDKRSGVIVDLSMIGQHYMNSNEFKIDAMSAIPFDLFGIFIGDIWWWTTYIKLFKSFRLLHLKKVKRLSDNQTVINMGRIMWVLVLFIVVMHIMVSCLSPFQLLSLSLSNPPHPPPTPPTGVHVVPAVLLRRKTLGRQSLMDAVPARGYHHGSIPRRVR